MINTKVFEDFSGGWWTNSPIFAKMDNGLSPIYGMKAAEVIQNVHAHEKGLEKFLGFIEQLNSDISGNPDITGIYAYNRVVSGVINTYFIVTAGTKVYTQSGGSLTEIFSGITSGLFPWFVTYANTCLIMNGEEFLKFDGTTCSSVTFTDPDSLIGSNIPRYAEKFRGRLFLTGAPDSPDTIWSPKPKSFDNFDDTTGEVIRFDISPGGGGEITGIRSLTKDLCIVYKTDSIHRFRGSAPFGSTVDPIQVEEVSSQIGCPAPRTIIKTEQDHYFLASENGGFRRYSTVEAYGDIKENDPSIAILDQMQGINYASNAIKKACATYVAKERHIYLFVPSGANIENDKCYVMDAVTGANMERTGITASCAAVVDGEFYTGDYNGMIHKQLSGDSYAGAVIDSLWESKWIPVGPITQKVNFKKLKIYFETVGTATIQVQIQVMRMDGSIRTVTKNSEDVTGDVFDTGLFDVARFDSTNQKPVFKKNNLGRGCAVKVKIRNNQANERWKVSRIELGYIPLKIGA